MGLVDRSAISQRKAKGGAYSTTAETPPPDNYVAPSSTSLSALLEKYTPSLEIRQKLLATATGALTSGASSLATNVPSLLKSVFSNTTVTKAAQFKTPASDALKTSMARGVPQAQTFTTNKCKNELQGLDFGTLSSTSATNLNKFDPTKLTAMSNKLGVAKPTSDKDLSSLKSLALSKSASSQSGGLFGSMKTFMSEGGSNTFTGSLVNSLGNFGSFTSFASGKAPGLSSITSSMSSYYTTGLPSAATSSGRAINGIPTSTSGSFMSGLTSASKALGISNILGSDSTYSRYSDNQNLFNTVLGSSATANIVPAVTAMTSDSRYNRSSQNVLANVLKSNRGGLDSNMISTLVSTVGGGNVRNRSSLIDTVVKGITSTTLPTNKGTLSNLGVSQPKSLFVASNKNYDGTSIDWSSGSSSKAIYSQDKMTDAEATLMKDVEYYNISKKTKGTSVTKSDGTLSIGSLY